MSPSPTTRRVRKWTLATAREPTTSSTKSRSPSPTGRLQWGSTASGRLLATLGQSTEPDLAAIVPVYDRMLAISLLLVGGIVALALIERVAWGSLGTSLAMVPWVVAATFFAYAGLSLVRYVAGYSALLATAWSPDLARLTETLMRQVAMSDAATLNATAGAHVRTFGLLSPLFRSAA